MAVLVLFCSWIVVVELERKGSQSFGQAFPWPTPAGTKEPVKSHCSSQISNSGQCRSVRPVKTGIIIVCEVETEKHAFYERGI